MKISYKEKFPTFQFLNCDIGFETDMDDSANPMEKLKELRNMAIAFHKQEFPHFYTDDKQSPTTPPSLKCK